MLYRDIVISSLRATNVLLRYKFSRVGTVSKLTLGKLVLSKLAQRLNIDSCQVSSILYWCNSIFKQCRLDIHPCEILYWWEAHIYLCTLDIWD